MTSLEQQVAPFLPTLNVDEEFFAKKFVSKLSSDERIQLAKLSVKFRENANDPSIYSYGYSFFSEFVSPKVNVRIFNAFVFTEELYPNSVIQEKAFMAFQGASLECVFQRFLNTWIQYKQNSKNASVGRGVPEAIRGLYGNKDFILTYALPFLMDSKIAERVKNALIRNVAYSLQNQEKNQFLPEQEVDILIAIGKKFNLNISPVIPSIRKRFNLDGVPDEWIRESFC